MCSVWLAFFLALGFGAGQPGPALLDSVRVSHGRPAPFEAMSKGPNDEGLIFETSEEKRRAGRAGSGRKKGASNCSSWWSQVF